eukprot:Opistho-1_new@19325
MVLVEHQHPPRTRMQRRATACTDCRADARCARSRPATLSSAWSTRHVSALNAPTALITTLLTHVARVQAARATGGWVPATAAQQRESKEAYGPYDVDCEGDPMATELLDRCDTIVASCGEWDARDLSTEMLC